ncbi:MAG: response regulator transcription factor [Candidatus Saccharimonadaceae bacterium]
MAKILLVEDDKSLREIYGVRLMAEGYEIVSAGDGEEALAMAIKERPDLIVSDVMMPKISGFDMLDILRSTTETKDVKVIMMTALSSDDQRARGEALGADRYLVKSQVGIEDVVRTVHDVLGDSIAPATPAQPTFGPAAMPAAAPAPQTVGAVPVISVPLPAPTPAPAAYVEPAAAPITAPAPMPAPVAITPPTPVVPPVPEPYAPAPVSNQALEAPISYQPSAPPPIFEAPAVPRQETPFAPVQPRPEDATPIQAAPAPAAYTEPAPAPMPAPVAITPPTPVVPPVPEPYAPAPVSNQALASTTLSEFPAAPTSLPQPTAPFSTSAPASLGERVIEPLSSPISTGTVDIASQIAQELNTPGVPPVSPTL